MNCPIQSTQGCDSPYRRLCFCQSRQLLLSELLKYPTRTWLGTLGALFKIPLVSEKGRSMLNLPMRRKWRDGFAGKDDSQKLGIEFKGSLAGSKLSGPGRVQNRTVVSVVLFGACRG